MIHKKQFFLPMIQLFWLCQMIIYTPQLAQDVHTTRGLALILSLEWTGVHVMHTYNIVVLRGDTLSRESYALHRRPPGPNSCFLMSHVVF